MFMTDTVPSIMGFTDEDAKTAIGEALGAASMCWDPTPEGVFQSERAAQLIDELYDHLHKTLPLLDTQPSGVAVRLEQKVGEVSDAVTFFVPEEMLSMCPHGALVCHQCLNADLVKLYGSPK